MSHDAADLERDLRWLTEVLAARLRAWLGTDGAVFDWASLPAPAPGPGAWGDFLRHHRPDTAERLVLLLALAPHVRPQLLDVLFTRNEAIGRGYTEFGGWSGATHGGFVPTGETACFLIAGDDLAERFSLMRLFEGDHWFARDGLLSLSAVSPPEPPLSGALGVSRELLHRLSTGAERKPGFSMEFPAHRIETELDWADLVLPAAILDQLEEIRSWILYGPALLDDWGMRSKLKPGFTSLFHGPPGTGKTLSASLLGKHCQCDVYRVDLSAIISKYIGETEKNLSRVFDMAENRRWILFFDEADALFGRRSRVDDSHDRYANQEVSYLLQRIEDFNGVVILASNMKSNIDDAFLRRFQSVVQFPMPRPAERERLWRNGFSPRARLDADVDLARLASRHELSGGTIMNVVRYASLRALSRGAHLILAEDLDEGVRRELQKEGRSV